MDELLNKEVPAVMPELPESLKREPEAQEQPIEIERVFVSQEEPGGEPVKE